jgi:DNA invertase Pin-like site-specific DNA recombinase
MKRVALYYRVSTKQQTTEPQRLELLEYCERRGWTNLREYSDKMSGAKWTRIGLEMLMVDVRKHRVDVVVCVKMDRLGRSWKQMAQIVGELETHRCALVCTSQPIDTTEDNPAGRLTMQILIAVADFERELIRERTKAGLAVARANGKRFGRPRFELTDQRKAVLNAWLATPPENRIFSELAAALGCSVGTAFALAKKAA